MMKKMLKCILVLSFVILAVTIKYKAAPGCTHPIFCNQAILEAVAKTDYYVDSKTFVDSVLTVPIAQALIQFKQKPIKQFLASCFTTSSPILLPTNLSDWTSQPPFLSDLKTDQLRQYASDLNRRWNELARKVDLNYKTGCTQDCSSFLPDVNGRTIIVPGGRFMECYYWDSYWIIKGLIVCDLLDTAETMINNFIIVIEKYGFIPNGFRQYYLNRSQPPFFSLMVKDVVQAMLKKGLKQRAQALQKRAFNYLIRQHEFFMKTHSKIYKLQTQRQILLNFYNAQTTSPRPQSFRQDMILVSNVTSELQKKRILKGISSMAQSGWDFSSRWLLNSDTDLKANIIQNIFPSDLNTLMAILEQHLTTLSNKYGRTDLVPYYQRLLKDRMQFMSQIYNGFSFSDASILKKRNQSSIFPSDFYPFLLFPEIKVQLNGAYNNTVNPVASFCQNGFQWDYPNVWAPNNWILHQVLSQKDRFSYAQEWFSTTYCSWKKLGLIYEKYSNNELGKRGEGGQYTVQTGFGWTNGLALYYIKLYGDRLSIPVCP